jgi:hypothetical protein
MDDINCGWLPSEEALSQADDLYLTHLETPDLAPLSAWLTTNLSPNPADKDVYEDAVFDISRLLEEYRYQAGVAAAFAIGLKAELADLSEEQLNGPVGMGIPAGVRALLAPYTAFLPLPSQLFLKPEQPISGFRLLGGWWAAQLYDSALIRGSAALDRLAAILYCVQGLEINREWMPAFKLKHLKRITAWPDDPNWKALLALLENPVFTLAKRYRDGFIHQSQEPMVLHGDHVIVRDAAGGGLETVRGITPEMHEAIVLGYFNLIVVVACDLVGKLVATPMAPAAASTNI